MQMKNRHEICIPCKCFTHNSMVFCYAVYISGIRIVLSSRTMSVIR